MVVGFGLGWSGKVLGEINLIFKNESMTVPIIFFGICYTELVMDSI